MKRTDDRFSSKTKSKINQKTNLTEKISYRSKNNRGGLSDLKMKCLKILEKAEERR